MAKMSVAATTVTTIDVHTELHTNYIYEEDVTIVWQYMFVGEECIQRALVGWYHGSPDEQSTEQFSRLGVMAQYIFD